MSLHELLRQPGIWRGRDHRFHHARNNGANGLPSGHPGLDEQLPDGGWPRGALTEILHDHPGQGELRLLLPALRHLTRDGRQVALVAPPWQPYAPALQQAGIDLHRLTVITPHRRDDAEWAVEQTLRAGYCHAVLAWPDRRITTKTLRRLQLAAEAGGGCGFLFRHSDTRRQHSPAALRLHLLAPDKVDVIKCRGRYFGRSITLSDREPAIA